MFRTASEAAGYLAAMVDGEGSVRAHGHQRSVHVWNSDEDIVNACLAACRILGVEARCSVRANPAPKATVPLFGVSIYGRENLEQLERKIVLQSSRKCDGLRRAVASYSRRRPVTRDELISMIDRGLTHREMALELGYKGHGTVQYHLRRLGLADRQRPYRPRCRADDLGREGFEELLRLGLSHREIAARLGVKSQGVVTHHLRRFGIGRDEIRALRRVSRFEGEGSLKG
jgi:hypothetical protein